MIVLDLSEIQAIGGGGLGMLAYLAHWAHDRRIQFKLYSPSSAVREGLVRNGSILAFEIAGFHELIDILTRSEHQQSMAA